MSVDLDKVDFASPYNAYKNDGEVYTGTIAFPLSLTANQNGIVNVTIPFQEPPTFSEFYAFFTEELDLTLFPNGTYGNPQWYSIDFSAGGGLGVWVTAPTIHQGVVHGYILPIISGNTITVQAFLPNTYSSTTTFAPLVVPFAFVSYSLAN